MAPDCRGIGLRRIAGKIEGILDDPIDAAFDRRKVRFGSDAKLAFEPFAKCRDRTAGRPQIHFRLRAIGADHRIALVVSNGPVGLRFDKRGTLAGPGAIDRIPHHVPDCDDVVSVDRYPGKAIGGGLAGDIGVERRHAERGGRGVEIVLADENDGRPLHRGEIHALMETAMIDRAVTEECHGDAVRALRASADARPPPHD